MLLLFSQVSEVSIQLYSLVHWEDPMDMTQGFSPISGVPSSTKEGTLQYRAGTTYLGKEQWKSCYLVLRYGQVKNISCYKYLPFKYTLHSLCFRICKNKHVSLISSSNGILYLYAEQTDVTPLLSVTIG